MNICCARKETGVTARGSAQEESGKPSEKRRRLSWIMKDKKQFLRLDKGT